MRLPIIIAREMEKNAGPISVQQIRDATAHSMRGLKRYGQSVGASGEAIRGAQNAKKIQGARVLDIQTKRSYNNLVNANLNNAIQGRQGTGHLMDSLASGNGVETASRAYNSAHIARDAMRMPAHTTLSGNMRSKMRAGANIKIPAV